LRSFMVAFRKGRKFNRKRTVVDLNPEEIH
jgi:hypothetical protein